jgi:hypothetical protein
VVWQPVRVAQNTTTSACAPCANAFKFKVLRGDKGIGWLRLPEVKVGRF